MQNLEISQQEHNLSGTDNHVHNPLTQAHDTLVFNSATDDTQYAIINPINHTSLPPYSLHTAPITLDNSETNANHLINFLPPITNLSISSDSITAKSEYCASNFLKVSITEQLFSKPMAENRFIFQTPIKLVMIPKRNRLQDMTKVNRILLFNSNHCKFLLKKLIAAQARTSTQEVRTPLNFQQMRIVASSNKKSVKCCCGKHSITKSAVHICNEC